LSGACEEVVGTIRFDLAIRPNEDWIVDPYLGVRVPRVAYEEERMDVADNHPIVLVFAPVVRGAQAHLVRTCLFDVFQSHVPLSFQLKNAVPRRTGKTMSTGFAEVVNDDVNVAQSSHSSPVDPRLPSRACQ
jgi:hypothetical protein